MRRLILALALAFAAGCVSNPELSEGQRLVESGDVAGGLERIERELAKEPGNHEMRNYYERHKAVAVQRYLQAGENARRQGLLEQAEAAYRLAQRFDPANVMARQGIAAVENDRKSASRVAAADAALKKGDFDAAHALAKEVLAENPGQREARSIARKVEEKKHRESGDAPKVNAAMKKSVTMELREAPLRQVFDLIQKQTGLNFVFDRDVPSDARATVNVRNTPIDEIVRFVLLTNGLERRVLNDNTILVYPNTPAKQQAHRDLVVRSFYLANADAKQTANLIRQVVKTRDIFIDEKLNLVVIRDSAEAVRLAEKLVANQDLAEAEVMLEVEVLEVSYTKLQQLGVQLPGSVGIGLVGAAGVPGQITGREAQRLNAGLVRITVPDPLITLTARQQDGRTNVLANPRIRVKSKEKARIHIGDRVPVVTTTAGATGFVSESINYLDVGLKLEVEPQVYLEDDVAIRIGLEVSNISREVKTTSGTIAYQVGTRNAQTTLRLRDGETQVLAGLINNEDRRSVNGTPGMGRLFSLNDDTVIKTEVVLLITPRVVRNIERPGVQLEQFSSGTESEVGGGASSGGPIQSLNPPVQNPVPQNQTPNNPNQIQSPGGPPSIPPQAPAAGPPPKPPAPPQ